MSEKSLRPTNEQIIMAADVISRHLQPTPLKKDAGFSGILDAEIFIKHEFLSPVKSFKIRGALNFVHKIASKNTSTNLLTASTGNHGASMAFACQKYDIPLIVCLPNEF